MIRITIYLLAFWYNLPLVGGLLARLMLVGWGSQTGEWWYLLPPTYEVVIGIALVAAAAIAFSRQRWEERRTFTRRAVTVGAMTLGLYIPLAEFSWWWPGGHWSYETLAPSLSLIAIWAVLTVIALCLWWSERRAQP